MIFALCAMAANALPVSSFAQEKKKIIYPGTKEAPDPAILQLDPGEQIQVRAYHEDTDTYRIALPHNPTAAPMDVTPESLARAVKAVSLKRMRRDPSLVVGNEYVTDHYLVLLYDFELAKRKKKP